METRRCAALVLAPRSGTHRVVRTRLGGGACGKELAWGIAALHRAVPRD